MPNPRSEDIPELVHQLRAILRVVVVRQNPFDSAPRSFVGVGYVGPISAGDRIQARTPTALEGAMVVFLQDFLTQVLGHHRLIHQVFALKPGPDWTNTCKPKLQLRFVFFYDFDAYLFSQKNVIDSVGFLSNSVLAGTVNTQLRQTN